MILFSSVRVAVLFIGECVISSMALNINVFNRPTSTNVFFASYNLEEMYKKEKYLIYIPDVLMAQ